MATICFKETNLVGFPGLINIIILDIIFTEWFQPNLMAIGTQFTRWLIWTNSYHLILMNSYDLREIVYILRGGKYVGIRTKDHA